MRTLLILVLLLPWSLLAQVKILMPVVVKDAAGQAVPDLKESDFKVSGPKNIALTDIAVVNPQPMKQDDARSSLVMIYDAVNLPTRSFELNVRDIRDFLSQAAKRKFPITLLVNSARGLRLIYNARTAPEVLLAALAATAESKTGAAEAARALAPAVREQIEALQLLNTTVNLPRSRLEAGVDQMNSLLARLLRPFPGRKALMWVTVASPVGATEIPAYWGTTTTHADQSLLPMYEATIEELNAADVSVYPFLFSQANPKDYGYLFDIWMGLKQLAESTGGMALRLGQETSLGAAADATMHDFGPYYMLTTEVSAPKELGWIPVKIKLDRPGVTVRERRDFSG
jgi:VWFA-related protein